MINIDKKQLVLWLKSRSDSNQTLYNFIDEICDKIYLDLKNKNLDLNISYYEFKQKMVCYLYKNSMRNNI